MSDRGKLSAGKGRVEILDCFDRLILRSSAQLKPILKQLIEQSLASAKIEFREVQGGFSDEAIEFSIPAQRKYLTLPRLVLAGIGASLSLTVETIEELKLALTEVGTNAVQHAYKGQRSPGLIVYRFKISDTRLVMEVIDSGVGMNPKQLETASQGNELGFLVMGKMVDKVEIASELGRGTLVRLISDLKKKEE